MFSDQNHNALVFITAALTVDKHKHTPVFGLFYGKIILIPQSARYPPAHSHELNPLTPMFVGIYLALAVRLSEHKTTSYRLTTSTPKPNIGLKKYKKWD